MAALHSYLNFNGNAEEALNFYKTVFGGEFSLVSRYKDIPSETPVDEKEADRILHIALPIGANSVLMASDVPASYPDAVFGTNFSISIHVDSREEAERVYNALSEGGQKTMPLEDTFWGAYFGMLTDQFGIHWLVSYDKHPE